MRTSWGPNKGDVKLPTPPDLSVGIVTHYTHHPYHEKRMEVVKLCLDSLLNGIQKVKYDLMIWDNGSTPDFIEMLESYNPDVLVKSYNIGVDNAQVNLAKLARGHLLCLSDDDILFHPRWFYQQHVILKNYPNVGVVSGSPQRTAFRWAIDSNIKFGVDNKCLTSGKLIPAEWERDFCISIGRNPLNHASATSNEPDYLLDYKGVKAWAHGHHMQFLGRTETILKFIDTRKCDVYLGNAHVFNLAIDKAGLLNLTTHERTAVHIGNAIDPSIINIMSDWGLCARLGDNNNFRETVYSGPLHAGEVR